MLPAVGERVPAFALRDQHGAEVALDDLAGRPALLVFYPFAFSGVCTGELDALRDDAGVFAAADVQVVAISCDPMFAQRAFADARGYDFPLLSDFWPHGSVAAAYGVFDTGAGRAERGSFLLDGDAVLRWSVVSTPGEARPPAAYREAIAAL